MPPVLENKDMCFFTSFAANAAAVAEKCGKQLDIVEAARFSLILWDAFDKAFKRIFKEEPACRIGAEKLLKYLIICLGEKSSVLVG